MSYLFYPHIPTQEQKWGCNLQRQLSELAVPPEGVLGNACGVHSKFIKKKECDNITFTFFYVSKVWREKAGVSERLQMLVLEMIYLTLSYVISCDNYIVL